MTKKTSSKWLDSQAEIILSQGLPRHILTYSLRQALLRRFGGFMWRCLWQGSGRTFNKEEDLFDEYDTLSCYWNTSPILDYFVVFHKLVNDMMITQLKSPNHLDGNTKFVKQFFPAYWGKYVTNCQAGTWDISTTHLGSGSIYSSQILRASCQKGGDSQENREQSTSFVVPLPMEGSRLMLVLQVLQGQDGDMLKLHEEKDMFESGDATRKEHLDSDADD
ncbi:hypothetical protein Tco_1227561 [Tanacetum coccineum]